MPPTTALRTAIHTALSADAILRGLLGQGAIHDAVPHGARPPFGLVETVSCVPLAGADGQGDEHLLDIVFWTAERGRMSAEALGEAAMAAIEKAAMGHPHRLANVERIWLRSGRDAATQWHFARLRIRAVVETPSEGG